MKTMMIPPSHTPLSLSDRHLPPRLPHSTLVPPPHHRDAYSTTIPTETMQTKPWQMRSVMAAIPSPMKSPTIVSA